MLGSALVLYCAAAYACFWLSVVASRPEEGPGTQITRAAIYLTVGPLLVAGVLAAVVAIKITERRQYETASA